MKDLHDQSSKKMYDVWVKMASTFISLAGWSVICFMIGLILSRTHRTSQPVEPSIKVVILDGVADTTYIYKFEK